ncbi:chemotaxis protein CheD [Eubacteriaceae bacterium ES2]|nr:chemotaxis protein CheD [Eubacteriaceae bacterium ES2]
MDHIIGVGDYKISDNKEDRLITYALSSCVAVIFYMYQPRIGGLIHIGLPQKSNLYASSFKDAYYAQTGLPLIINEFEKKFECDIMKMKIHLIGGSKPSGETDAFMIGERNVKTIQTMLAKRGLVYSSANTGGKSSRNVLVNLASGELKISCQQFNYNGRSS